MFLQNPDSFLQKLFLLYIILILYCGKQCFHPDFFTKKNKYDILYINYKGFIQRIIEIETVLLHTPWVKRNVGKGTPTNNSSLPYIRKSNAIEV